MTFSGPHAIQCRALVLTVLDRLVARAAEVSRPEADRGWLDWGQGELSRMLAAYRVPGDETLAFAEYVTPG